MTTNVKYEFKNQFMIMICWYSWDEVPDSSVIIYYALFHGFGVICYVVLYVYDNKYVTIMIVISVKQTSVLSYIFRCIKMISALTSDLQSLLYLMIAYCSSDNVIS